MTRAEAGRIGGLAKSRRKAEASRLSLAVARDSRWTSHRVRDVECGINKHTINAIDIAYRLFGERRGIKML